MSAPRFWHLILYVDSSSVPQHVTIELPRDMHDLLTMVEDVSGVAIVTAMYWDPVAHAYMPLTSLEPIQRCHGRAQLWLQSNGLRLEVVQRGSDNDELRELRRHGASLNTEFVAFQLVEAHRITYPLLEQQFYERVKALVESSAPTMLLWYAGNGNSSSDAVQQGFVLPRSGAGLTFVTSLSDPRRTSPPPHLQKVLLCEVAVGRVATAIGSPTASQGIPNGFDSLVRTTDTGIRAYTVPHAHQAIPRYILSLKGVQTAAAGGAATVVTNSLESSRRETPPRRSKSNDARPPRAASSHGRTAATREPSSPAPQQSASAPSTPPLANKADFTCAAHPEEQTTLWCATCSQLVCPYCLSVGQHRGHDGRELDDVVTKFRSNLSEMIHALTDRQDAASRTLDVMRASKREIQDRCKQAEVAIETAFRTLSAQLDAKRQALLDDMRKKTGHADEHTETFTQYADSCASKRKELESLLIGAQDTSRTAKMRFLRSAQGPLAEWQSKSLQPPPLPNVLPAGSVVCTHVNIHPCEAAIEKLCMQKHHTPRSGGDGRSLVGSPTSPETGEDAQSLTVLQHQVAIQRSHLEDLTCGYIWNVPQAEKLFHVDQRKDIFSDVFHLCGAAWELRIASEAVPATATPNGAAASGATTEEHLQDNLSVYLHSVNHQHRINFRVILFASGAGAWHVREAKGWSTEFAGKGWGIRPFCPRKLLLREFVRDGLIKLCVAPIGGLY